MSYIEIQIGGKLQGLRFNQISLEIFAKHLNLEAPASSAIYATFYAGLYGNSVLKNEDINYTFEQSSIWVDELYEAGRKEDIQKVCDAWEATNYYRDWLKEFQDRLRLLTDEQPKFKKKMKGTMSGSKSTNLRLVS